MKKTIIRLVAVLTVIFMSVACGEKSGDDVVNVSGEWHLVSYEGIDISDVEVYLKFDKGIFDLYQKLEEGRFRHYHGSYSVNGNTMTGQYDDGEPLGGGSYTVSLESDNSTLTLIPQNDPNEISVYEHAVIPNEVIGNAIETKSLIDNERRML